MLPECCDNFLYYFKGTPSARQAGHGRAEGVCRDAEISRGESRAGQRRTVRAERATGGRAYSGAAACRALRAEAHRARRSRRSSAPQPQAGGTRSNAPSGDRASANGPGCRSDAERANRREKVTGSERSAAHCPGRPLQRQGQPEILSNRSAERISGPALERPSLCRLRA